MDDEIYSIEEAAEFMKLGTRTIRELIFKGVLTAGRTSKKGKYRILKSACLDCVKTMQQNVPVGGGDRQEGDQTQCRSLSGIKSGTVTSQRQTVNELDVALGLRTRKRPRSSMTN